MELHRQADVGHVLADLVFEIPVVALIEQASVIGEEDDFRDGDGAEALRLGLRAVEDFEALAAARCGRMRGHGFGDDAVQHAGGHALFRTGADFLDVLEKTIKRLAGLRAEQQHGRVADEKKLDLDLLQHGLQFLLVRGLFLDEVPLVHRDDARFFCLLNEAGDLLVLRGHALRGVNDQAAQVRAADARFAAHDAENFHGIVALALRADAGGINEHVVMLSQRVEDVHGVARRAADGRDERALVAEDGVCERGLADIRPADDRDAQREILLFTRSKFLLRRREQTLDFLDEPLCAEVVLGADGEQAVKAELRKFIRIRSVLRVIDFVHDQNDRLARAPQPACEIVVHAGEAVLAVHDEQDHVARLDGDLRLGAHLLGERHVHIRTDAAGVEDRERRAAEFALRRDAIARHTRLIVDDCDFFAGEAVEKSGLADIRAAYDCYSAGHWTRNVDAMG